MRKFSKDHEWIDVDGDLGVVGITNFAQEQLGDVVFVELPEEDQELTKGDESAVVESVKAASEVIAIVSGTVTEVNEELVDSPGRVNGEAEGDAWFYKIKMSDPSECDDLMDADAYKAFVAEQSA